MKHLETRLVTAVSYFAPAIRANILTSVQDFFVFKQPIKKMQINSKILCPQSPSILVPRPRRLRDEKRAMGTRMLELLRDGHPIKYGRCIFRISFCHLNTTFELLRNLRLVCHPRYPIGICKGNVNTVFMSIFRKCPRRAIRANKPRSICRGSTRSLVRVFVIVLRTFNDFSFIFLKRSKKFAVSKMSID